MVGKSPGCCTVTWIPNGTSGSEPHWPLASDLRNPMSRCVLVAEDEALVNNFTSSELRAAGCEVLTAYDTDEAIRILEKRSDIDLVFTDINMPGSFVLHNLVTTEKSA